MSIRTADAEDLHRTPDRATGGHGLRARLVASAGVLLFSAAGCGGEEIPAASRAPDDGSGARAVCAQLQNAFDRKLNGSATDEDTATTVAGIVNRATREPLLEEEATALEATEDEEEARARFAALVNKCKSLR